MKKNRGREVVTGISLLIIEVFIEFTMVLPMLFNSSSDLLVIASIVSLPIATLLGVNIVKKYLLIEE